MKKLYCLILISMMLIPAAARACEEAAVLPNIETNGLNLTGGAWLAVSQENHLLFGKLAPDEKLDISPARSLSGVYVRGITAEGVIREKGEMRYVILDGAVCGLTKADVSITISTEYQSTVESIVSRRMGKADGITAADVMACTIGRTETTVYHYMFGRYASYIEVGTAVFNGKNAVSLCVGDWNGDGLSDLGFPVFLGRPEQETKEPEPEPAAEPEPEPIVIHDTVYVKETVVREVVREKTCVKVIQNNFQLNINSTVKNCQKVILGGCHAVQCAE